MCTVLLACSLSILLYHSAWQNAEDLRLVVTPHVCDAACEWIVCILSDQHLMTFRRYQDEQLCLERGVQGDLASGRMRASQHHHMGSERD